MNVDAYIFLRFVVIFSEFLSFLFSVLRVSPETDPSRRDRSVSVPAESAAETATVNHGICTSRYCMFHVIDRCSMRLDMLRGAGVFLYLFRYYCLPLHSCCFCSFLDSLYISLSVVIPFPVFI